MTPARAYYKAKSLGKRIPEFEPIILEDAYWSYNYAHHVIKGRWELAEPIISKDVNYSYIYARDVIKGRWEIGEEAISKNSVHSFWYAQDLLKSRLPDFMHNAMIFSKDKVYVKFYVDFIESNQTQ